MSDRIKLDRDELFSAEVDAALARERAMRGAAGHAPPPVSPLRALLMSSMFYLPVAALIGAIAAWGLLEPYINDHAHAAGEVLLVNGDPFDAHHAVSMTIGDSEAIFVHGKVKLLPGAHGQKAFASLADITTGSVVEVIGIRTEDSSKRMIAYALRPSTDEDARGVRQAEEDRSRAALMAFFPLTATLIAFGLLVAEALSARNWLRLVERGFLGSFMAALFSVLASIPAGVVLVAAQKMVANAEIADSLVVTAANMPPVTFAMYATARSLCWACLGAGLGVGMNLVRSTRAQLRNSATGGALGGALGGLFFDPIDRFVRSSPFHDSSVSRVVGVAAVGLSIGLFVALVERLTREAWLRVRTGPLAGKSFILYKSPTSIGSAPSADIYLFKDAAIDGEHAIIHRVGNAYEIEDLNSREGTLVGGRAVRRRRLSSGDQITIGSTVLEFEERAARQPAPAEVKAT
jgi:hypothetical protein